MAYYRITIPVHIERCDEKGAGASQPQSAIEAPTHALALIVDASSEQGAADGLADAIQAALSDSRTPPRSITAW